jgi:hypothetical protein
MLIALSLRQRVFLILFKILTQHVLTMQTSAMTVSVILVISTALSNCQILFYSGEYIVQARFNEVQTEQLMHKN